MRAGECLISHYQPTTIRHSIREIRLNFYWLLMDGAGAGGAVLHHFCIARTKQRLKKQDSLLHQYCLLNHKLFIGCGGYMIFEMAFARSDIIISIFGAG